MPLYGTNGVVSGSRKPLPGMGCRRNSFDRIARSSAEGDHPGGEHDVGITIDRRKCNEVERVEGTYGRIDTRYRLQQETRVVSDCMQSIRHTNGGQARMEPHKVFSWFRATLTSWLYMVTKDHMKKYQKEYRQFLAEIGPEVFKRPLLTHRNAITTGWKRVDRVSRNKTKARESILEEDLAKNVSLNLHNSFCLNRESRVKSLPNQAKRLQEQREWMRSYEQLKAWEEIVISSDDEEALLKQITVSNTSGSGTSKAKNAR